MAKGFFLVIGLYLLISGIRFRYYIVLGTKLSAEAHKFERLMPGAAKRILVSGDSSAFGTGAAMVDDTVAGRFGKDFPDAEIVNASINGRRLAQQLELFQNWNLGEFDYIDLQIGGNDIVRGTSYADIRSQLDQVLAIAKQHAPIVTVIHSGNIGASPIFPYPVNWYFSYRTRKIRDIYLEVTKKHGVLYVDLYQKRSHDLFATDIARYYLEDQFHPSAEGYRVWYEYIRARIAEEGVSI